MSVGTQFGSVNVFQSLFYWKYLSDFSLEPCDLGFLLWFQSLFYWKYLSDIRKTDKGYQVLRFQSLFYWKYLSDNSESSKTHL